ncbi:long-chain acyl-CoA synthetase [Quadrisphaera granulorum]|uniref:Long-chain acyl-CoA synthetase n=1 Tax=Quadrisphaera granulorum TaxID=317664 RepID=A0A316AAH4_9ACTN|nr:long-chain fatty acid--CoA ligase [Quadrisphaera granulorum]PWJ54000.1 long-chain acyl-CoA synthetase [Quadrisphaera granulorum]SZE96457.1 long-chain acyl-CoA synthetase [Quadrisphaera granulorum]
MTTAPAAPSTRAQDTVEKDSLELIRWPDPRADALTGPGLGSLSVASLLASSAGRHADRIAVVCGEERVTYAELWDQARAYAGAFRARGIGPGDRVAVLVPNVPDFPRVYFGLLALGAVVVPVHLLFTADEVEHVIRDSGATLVVAAAPVLAAALPAAAAAGVPVVTVLVPDALRDKVPAPRLEDEAAATEPLERLVPVPPLAPATVLYTSGTTGKPKGAVGSHLAIVENVNVVLIDCFDMRTGDVVFGGLPLFHTFGQVCVMNTAFRVGATVLLLPKFDPATALKIMDAERATVFIGVPTMYGALLQAAGPHRDGGAELPPLRYAISGGAALPEAVLDRFQQVFGAPVHEGYGLTETSPVASFNRVGEPAVAGSVGFPVWGVEAEVTDPAHPERIVVLPRGERGELVIRGHNLFKGYLGNPDATEAAVVDGWLRTGDIATKDDEGRIRIVDRAKDMIIRNGYNVYCREVEEVLVRYPGVASVAVFGVADDEHGQEVHAAVVLEDSEAGRAFDADAMVTEARQHLAAYKYPRVVHVREAMPQGPSGKILKRELVAEYES